MEYELYTNNYEYPSDEINIALFDDILDGFNADVWDFMVLSPSTPIQGSTFIQVGAPQEIVDFNFTVEIGFYNENTGLKTYRYYTKNLDIALKYLIDYYEHQQIPDIQLWEDVSDEMNAN